MALTATPRAELRLAGQTQNDLASLVQAQGARFGDASYLEEARGPRSTTFAQLSNTCERWARHLRAEGIDGGATLALSISDPLTFADAYIGIMAAGCWVMPLDPAGLDLDPGRALAPALRLGARSIVTDDPSSDDELPLRTLDRPSEAISVDEVGPQAVRTPLGGGVILASSGTTGAPKIIRLPQGHLLHTARQVALHHQLSTADRAFNSLPLFHINAEVVGLLANLAAGSTLVLDERFHRTGFWELMERKRVTWINAVPAIVTLLADVRPGERAPGGLRFVRSASAPLPSDTLAAFEASFGIPLIESYGMTEAASQIAANPLEGPRKAGSVGLPVGVEVRVDPTVAEDVGGLQIKGPSVIGHYEGDVHADRFTDDGWLRTGDVGWIDPEGFVYLLGREDDVINRSGEKVFPREIEEILLADEAVAAAAVVPKADAVLGQVPLAFVELRPGVENVATRDEIADRLVSRLARLLVRTKRPSEIRVVTQLPTGPTGKVLRRAVRENPPPSLLEVRAQ